MKAIHKEINPWTLKFHNAELENSYQSARISFDGLPFIGKVIIFGTLFFAVIRRLQLLFDSLYGSSMYDSAAELRLTFEFLIGVALELLFTFVKPLFFLQGVGIIIGGYWSVIDASCYYYPAEPSLTPMYFLGLLKC